MKKMTRKIVPIAMSVLMAVTCTQGIAFAEPASAEPDIAALKQAVETAKSEMEAAGAEKDQAEKALAPLEQTMEEKQAAVDAANEALKKAENELAEAQSNLEAAETARDNAFEGKKSAAQTALNNATAAYDQAVQDYNAAASAVTEKETALQAARAQKTQLEQDIETLTGEKEAAEASVSSLSGEIPQAEQAVAAAQSQWDQNKATAAQVVEEAQAALDSAGRDFIDQKINEKNGYNLDEMIAACKTYTGATISSITDKDGNTYNTVADVANSANFEKVVDRACTYDNLKQNIEYIREANAHRNLPIHNAGSLKVSYQLMGTAIISNAICVFQTGHNLTKGGWTFWNSGNSMTMSENLAYSPVPSGQWDPFHGWYYKERMRAVANARSTDPDQSIVNEILAESTANGYTYNPYGPPWNQSESYFLSSISTVTGHYDSLIKPEYKATGFSYIDGIDYQVTRYPYVAAQEFNGDTSASVSVDQYEEELDAWFEQYLSDLETAQAARQALESKPESLVNAENALQQKQQALSAAQQTVSEKENAISAKQGELNSVNADITAKESELTAARSNKENKLDVKNRAETEKDEAAAAKAKADALKVDDPETYADFADLKELVDACDRAAGVKAEKDSAKESAESTKESAEREKENAESAYNSAEADCHTKVEAYNTAKGKYNAAVTALEAATDLTKATITVSNTNYTGEAQEPAPEVVLGGVTLVKDTDYEVAYDNNINAGKAIVTVTGKGEYRNSKTVNFVINPKKVTPAVTLSAGSYVYNGKVKTPAVTVKNNTAVLKNGTDYTVSYAAGRKNAGKYSVKVSLKGNYSGTATKTFTINKAKNPMVVKVKKPAVKFASLKKKNQVIKVKSAFAVSKNQGKVTYKKTKGNARILVASAGNVTVKKGLKKGTYKITVKVTAKGNANYNALSKTVILAVKVK